MEITSALIYSLRFAPKLAIPPAIQANIAKLRLVPAAYRPIRAAVRHPRARRAEPDNWREHVLKDFVKRIREVEDSDYDTVFETFNKVAPATVTKLSHEVIQRLQTRDDSFRLRVTTLLFDKAISQSFFAGVMADMARELHTAIPAVADDLETHVKLFHVLYDMRTTAVYPSADEEGFEEKVVAWAKQKNTRRGYARFLTHLYVRTLVSAQPLHSAVDSVLADLEETVCRPLTPQTEENVTQFADFLFEIANLLPKEAVELRGLLTTKLKALLARPRPELPSLNMRSRFKLEDTIKRVQ